MSISTADRDATIEAFVAGIRFDRRQKLQPREVFIKFEEEYGRVEVSIGKTRVMCTVTADITEPPANRPNEGQLAFHVDLGPMANPAFQMGRDAANNAIATDIVTMIERMLRGSRAVDTEALCIVGGSKVWTVRVDVRALNDDGNLRDCCALAALCGLKHYKHEEVVVDSVSKDITVATVEEREPVPLSIHHYPMLISFAICKGEFVLDPSEQEESVAEGFLSVAVNQFGELCGLHKPGGSPLTTAKVLECVAAASTRATILCDLVGKAHAKFEEDRKERRKNVHQRYSTAGMTVANVKV